MKNRLLKLCAATALMLLPNALHADPPSNDNFANAAEVTLGETAWDNTLATAEPGESSHVALGTPALYSIWLKYKADFDGYVTLDTTGSTQADTIAAVYVGKTLATRTLIARNDDNGASTQAKLTFRVTAGTTYAIALDSKLDNGLFRLQLTAAQRFSNLRYEGSILPPAAGRPNPAEHGRISIATTAKGTYTGTVTLGKSRISIRGNFPVVGGALNQIDIPGTLGATVILAPVPSATKNLSSTIGAILRVGLAEFVTELYSVPKYTKTNPCPRAGRYNFTWNTLAIGIGQGYGTMVVGSNGLARAVGVMGDATPFSFASLATNDAHVDDPQNIGTLGRFPFHTALAGGGQISGHFATEVVRPDWVSGTTRWFSPAGASRKDFQRSGYEFEMLGAGALYTKPAANTRLAPIFDANNGNGTFTLTHPLEPARNQNINLTTANEVTAVGPLGFLRDIQFKLAPATGILTGKYLDLASGENRTFGGIYVPGNFQAKFYGIFTAKSGCGSMSMQP